MALELLTVFPYFKVGNYIFDKNYGQLSLVNAYKEAWPNNKITQIWYYYKDGIENGSIKAVSPYESTDALNYLDSVTSYPRAHIMWWLQAVYDLARSGNIDMEVWTGKGIPDSPLEGFFARLKNAFSNATKPIRTGVIIAIAGASVFYIWPLISKMRK